MGGADPNVATALRTTESGPLIEEADISAFERKHGVHLSVAYRAFLLRSNGGRPERDLFPVPGLQRNPVGRLHFFFGIGDPVESCDLEWNLRVFADRIPAHLLPIATTEGADKICLAVAGDASGTVFYWDGYEGSHTPKLYRIARDFDEFVALLYAAGEGEASDDGGS
jgi:hypothetical protein